MPHQALFLGVMLAGGVAVAGLLLGRMRRHEVIAYGPFLCLGALLVLPR